MSTAYKVLSTLATSLFLGSFLLSAFKVVGFDTFIKIWSLGFISFFLMFMIILWTGED